MYVHTYGHILIITVFKYLFDGCIIQRRFGQPVETTTHVSRQFDRGPHYFGESNPKYNGELPSFYTWLQCVVTAISTACRCHVEDRSRLGSSSLLSFSSKTR